MFDFVRNHKRWLQFLLVLLVFPSFVFFGVQGYSGFMDQSNTTVATYDGGKITQTELDAEHRKQIDRYREQVPDVDVKLLDTPEMKRQTLQSMLRQRVLAQAVVKDHLTVGDERLQRLFVSDPAYAVLRQADGSVNPAALAQRGLTSQGLAQMLRSEFETRQVTQGAADGAFLAKTVADDALAALLERRSVQMDSFGTVTYMAKVNPTDADVKAWYDSHQNEMRTPEQAKIEYVVLDLAALQQQASVNEDELHQYYEQNKSRYGEPEERRASHILIAVASGASADVDAAAKAQAEKLLAEVRAAPARFAELAKTQSKDPGSAAKGGDLDFFGRGAMVKPFEEAVFGMKQGDTVVVKSDFGYHVILLTGVRGGTTKPYETVRAEIETQARTEAAQKRYAEVAEQFANTAYEQPDSLQPLVDKLKLPLQTATVGREPAPGASGPLASPKLLAAVFAEDSLTKKHNTEATETGASQLVAARVVTHLPATVQPLEVVRAQVLTRVKAQQASAQARKDGEARLAEVKKDMALKLTYPVTVSRAQGQGLPQPIVQAIVRADLRKGPVALGVDLGEQGYAVVKVEKAMPPEAEDPDRARARPFIEQALAQAEADAFDTALKTRFKAELVGPYAPGAASMPTK
ncbi:MAG: SurA N-terminal domain-containing protein [Proteobacteria bacterium]|nr:SurA N-terminal domain-containing protein [Pseudomonadota bacterium]